MKSNLYTILSSFVPQIDETPQEWLGGLLHNHLPGLATQNNLKNLLGGVLSQVEFSSGFTREQIKKLFEINTYLPMNNKTISNESVDSIGKQKEHKHLSTIYDAVNILKNESLNDFQKLLINLAILDNAECGLAKIFHNIKTLLQNNEENSLALSELLLLRELTRNSATSAPSSTAFRKSLDRLYQAMTENANVPANDTCGQKNMVQNSVEKLVEAHGVEKLRDDTAQRLGLSSDYLKQYIATPNNTFVDWSLFNKYAENNEKYSTTRLAKLKTFTSTKVPLIFSDGKMISAEKIMQTAKELYEDDIPTSFDSTFNPVAFFQSAFHQTTQN